MQHSEWNGKTIELSLFNATLLEVSRERALDGYLTVGECQHWMERGQMTLKECRLSVVQCQQLVERQVVTSEECHADRRLRKEKQEKEYPLETVPEEYAKHLEGFNNALDHIVSDGP